MSELVDLDRLVMLVAVAMLLHDKVFDVVDNFRTDLFHLRKTVETAVDKGIPGVDCKVGTADTLDLLLCSLS